MVISTNLISTPGGRMNNQTVYAKSAQNSRGTSEGFFENNILIEFYSKNVTFMTHFGGRQLTS